MHVTRTEFIDGLVGVFLLVVGAWGAIESLRRDEPGLAALFVLLVAVSLGAAVVRRTRSHRPVLVRSDLHRWLEVTSGLTGETASDIADRCLSSCRAETQG